jgi:hypothetical protein
LSARARLPAAAVLAILVAAAGPLAVHGQRLTLTVDSIEHPQFALRGAEVRIDSLAGGPAEIRLRELRLLERAYRDVRLHCPDLRLQADVIECAAAQLSAGDASPTPVRLRWAGAAKTLEVEIRPAPDERLMLVLKPEGGANVVRLAFEAARIERLAPFVEPLARFAVKGRVSGEAVLRSERGRSALTARLALAEGAFAEASGGHAGEGLAGSIEARAEDAGVQWDWHTRLALDAGEIYSAPWYWAKRAATVEAAGRLAPEAIEIVGASVVAAGIGRVDLAARLSRPGLVPERVAFTSGRIELAEAVPVLLAPLLAQGGAPVLQAGGGLRAAGRIEAGSLAALDLEFDDAGFGEAGGRWGVRGIGGTLPWRAREPTRTKLRVAGANFGKLPLGTFDLEAQLEGLRFALPRLAIPVLDGRLVLEDARAARVGSEWSGQLGLALEPVSMPRLTEALGLPRMPGALSASLPRISHERSTLQLDGAFVVQVFDGFVSATNLQLIEPFGRTPRLLMDAELRHLDLGQLTEAFSFGSITGFIDGEVKGLEMAGWRPLRFDAFLASSPGDYRRRISQRAVQNISALGGAGAAAAIQRSVLRVFEEFGYARLGLSCRLRDGVCTMGGIEEGPSGYVIVKGGGVPAISVLGYNRRVDWDELLTRLKRITASNARPVIE